MQTTYQTSRTTVVTANRLPKAGVMDVYAPSGSAMVGLDMCLPAKLALKLIALAQKAGTEIRYENQQG